MKQHIVVVDDESQIRELLDVYLTKQGYKVSTASSREETITILASNRIDLVVLDIGLAKDDGLHLLTEIKSKYPKVRVVMLTGMGFVEDLLEEAYDKGADGYVSKVLSLDELLTAIRRTLKPGENPSRAKARTST